MDEKQRTKILDTAKTHFSDEKEMTKANAKNSELIIQGRKAIADTCLQIASDEKTPYAEKMDYIRMASEQIDKGQVESNSARTTDERRSQRKTLVIGCLAGASLALTAGKIYHATKNELPKLLSKTTK